MLPFKLFRRNWFSDEISLDISQPSSMLKIIPMALEGFPVSSNCVRATRRYQRISVSFPVIRYSAVAYIFPCRSPSAGIERPIDPLRKYTPTRRSSLRWKDIRQFCISVSLPGGYLTSFETLNWPGLLF